MMIENVLSKLAVSSEDLNLKLFINLKILIAFQIGSSEIIKIKQKVVLDGSVLPSPSICVEKTEINNDYECGMKPIIGKKTMLNFPANSNFRIDAIWVGYEVASLRRENF